MYPYGISWTPSSSTGCSVPTCMQTQPGTPPPYSPVYVREITIGQVASACNYASFLGSNFAKICISNPCFAPNGQLSRIWVYETLPFQAFPGGLPTGGGGVLPVCGLDFQIVGRGTGANCWDLPLCGSGPFFPEPISIVFPVDCFNQIIDWFIKYHLLSPPGYGSYLTNDSVVFVVAIKCGSETTCCEP